MLPVAGALVVLGAVFAFRLARAWQALNDRLDRAAAGVRRIWRGRADSGAGARSPRSTPGTRLAAIWLPLAAAQIALYLVQENVEAVARSQPAPGLGAITGIHWAAPFVHLYVSLLLACVVRICQVLFHRREVGRRAGGGTPARHRHGAGGPHPSSFPVHVLSPSPHSTGSAGISGEGRRRCSSASDRRP